MYLPFIKIYMYVFHKSSCTISYNIISYHTCKQLQYMEIVKMYKPDISKLTSYANTRNEECTCCAFPMELIQQSIPVSKMMQKKNILYKKINAEKLAYVCAKKN